MESFHARVVVGHRLLPILEHEGAESDSQSDPSHEETSRNKKILVLSDNITAIANVVKEGGNNNTEYIRELKDLYWLIKSLNCR